jgi:predicted helicase
MQRTDNEKAQEQEVISRHYQEEANKNINRQKRDGVVVTPTEVVDFQIKSVIERMKTVHGRDPDQDLEWLDPFGGSGIYTARLLQIVDLPPDRKYALSQNCIVIEIDPIAAQICANNLAKVLLEETGVNGFVRVICTDTFALSPDADLWADSLPVVKPTIPYCEPEDENDKPSFVEIDGKRYKRKHGITDEGFAHFRKPYPSEPMNKTDVYYYVYGLLQSEEYKEKYKDNLTKELPRIPQMRRYEDFKVFSRAGRELAFLHLNFDNKQIAMYEADIVYSPDFTDCAKCFYVNKMKFGKGKDKTTIIYNDFITINNVPLAAYEYVVNGKPAIEWVIERQAVTTHKESGITNDANDWAVETMDNPKYPLELLLRVIQISLSTMKIVKNLPKLDIYKP